jgi:hypothetical protein
LCRLKVSGKYQISGVSPTFRLTATSTASGLCAPVQSRLMLDVFMSVDP